MASGFHQIDMAEEDFQKVAFNTESDHYEFVRMVFELRKLSCHVSKRDGQHIKGSSECKVSR